MRYLKLFEYYNDLESDLVKYGINNYIINNDGTIDVDGNVNLYYRHLYQIPFQFGRVTGDFNCSVNKLKSLEGCPKYVSGRFQCSNNKLVSLKGCPNYVGGDFRCSNNKLVSLKGCPKHINGNFYCGNNEIKYIPYD